MRVFRKRISVCILILLCVIALLPVSTFAKATVPGEEAPKTYAENKSPSSWLYDQDVTGIYGDAGEVDLSAEKAEEDKPGLFESLLMEPIKGLGNAINEYLESGHITLDSIIMGRVDGHGVALQSEKLGNHVVALFTFELSKGNIFGIISANVYVILRSIVYIVIVCAVFAKVVAAGWKGNGAKAMLTFKNAFGELALVFLMLQLMPYILDLIFYIRDVMLHGVYTGLVTGMGLNVAKVSGLSAIFKELADDGLLNSCMYLGTALITVWFMMQYVGLALSFCVYFFCFPMVCVNSLYSRNELMEWWKSVIGYALVPVGDLVLMFIPAAFGLLGASHTISVIQFCVCAMLIPTRSVLRAAMGIRSNFAMEMAASGAIGGAVRFAGGVAKAAGKTISGIAGGTSDLRKGEMHAQASKEGVGLSGGGGASAGGGGTGGALTADMSGGSGMSGYEGSSFSYASAAQQDILNRNANVSNFEDKEFNGLSDDRRAELYRQRGKQRLAGAVLGGAAGLAGAALGGSAGMFMGVDTAGHLGGALAEGGAQVGQTGVAYGSGFTRELGDFGENVRKWGQRNTPGYHAKFGDAASLLKNSSLASSGGGVDSVGAYGSADIAPVALEGGVEADWANVSPSLLNDSTAWSSDFKNPEFEEYISNQYDAIMADESFPTRQARADELGRRAQEHTVKNFDSWFASQYPNAPQSEPNHYHGTVNNHVATKYRFNEETGENTWDILAGEGSNAKRFTFE